MKSWDTFIDRATNKYGGSDVAQTEFEVSASGGNAEFANMVKPSSIPKLDIQATGGASVAQDITSFM
jgi:hypothetical protein